MCEVRDLKPNGANILVTEENKKEYVHLVCQMKMTGEIMFIHCLIHSQQQTSSLKKDHPQKNTSRQH